MSVISMITFTKWWYVGVVDAPNSMMWGFPLIWVSQGWHTSMSYQVFIAEMLANLIVHLGFWLAVTWFVDRFSVKIIVPKVAMSLLWLLAITCLFLMLWLGSLSDTIYHLQRGFDIEVLDTGYRFFWEDSNRPS